MNNIKLQEELVDMMIYVAIGWGFMAAACIIVAVIVVVGVTYKMQNGWSLREAVRRELKDWP